MALCINNYHPKFPIKSLDYNTEKLILNVFEFFKMEKEQYGVSDKYFIAVQKRVTKAVGICERTLRNILKQHENENNTEEIVNQQNLSPMPSTSSPTAGIYITLNLIYIF